MIDIGKRNTIDLNGDGKIDRYGLVWNYTEPYFYVPWIGGFGDWLIKNDNEPNLNTIANINGFEFIKSSSIQTRFSKQLNTIPSSKISVKEISEMGNPIVQKLFNIISYGKPMPVVPEIRAIWDALRVQYQALLGGTITPEVAAIESQKGAESQI